MHRQLVTVLTGLTLLLPFVAIAGPVTDEDFMARDTQSLVNLCTATPDDPRSSAAIHFCHGYLVGAFHYYKVTHAAPDSQPLFCFPDPPPSRNQAITQFVAWAKDHPQYMKEVPVETEFRFLTETWPCK
jgi:hypothetical protein